MATFVKHAEEAFRKAADSQAEIDKNWESQIEKFSNLCKIGGSVTHIAVLATSILAKVSNPNVDLYAIKPKHASNNQNAYSARSLCHKVVVPLSAELEVNIGVNGREPLNNQPYFRMTRLGDKTPIHSRSKESFNFLLELIKELSTCTQTEAQKALEAFIMVRRRHNAIYPANNNSLAITWAILPDVIAKMVQERSEGGRRAQAVVAGLFDVFAGSDYIECGKINDPSRHHPGDVALRGENGEWEKAVEVRDKIVTESDVNIFCRDCLSRHVREAAIVMTAENQSKLNRDKLIRKAAKDGLGLTLFYGWHCFVDQILFWCRLAKPDAIEAAVRQIELRLIKLGASREAVESWQHLTRNPTRVI